MDYYSRKSPVYSQNGMVACSQPLAANIGLNILQHEKGNAVDAAVAVAAALAVLEPHMTGIGGDMSMLYYDNNSKQVLGLNGAGRSPKALTLERVKAAYGSHTSQNMHFLPASSVHCVTCPGAVAGWVDAISKWGSLPLQTVLEPAIKLASDGFPVSPISAHLWQKSSKVLQKYENGHELLLPTGKRDIDNRAVYRAPDVGEIFHNQFLANCLSAIALQGKDGFYNPSCRVANEIVAATSKLGGLLTLDDLTSHSSTFDKPISTNYRDLEIYELPPNGQGLTALLAFNMLNQIDKKQLGDHNSAAHLHTLIEVMRIAFADSRWYICDPTTTNIPIEGLLSKSYASKRLQDLYSPSKANANIPHGCPTSGSDTVSFQTVDRLGNAVSFVNSVYTEFGSGIVPHHCGFALQNRGANFNLQPDHPNVLAGFKRPYHTIIPGIALREKELFSSFTVMGGFNQPQAHVQVISNMVDYGMDPQMALDVPRFCIVDGKSDGKVGLEQGIPQSTVEELQAMGQRVLHDGKLVSGNDRELFGRGQIINRLNNGVLVAGSDSRADGLAIGY